MIKIEVEAPDLLTAINMLALDRLMPAVARCGGDTAKPPVAEEPAAVETADTVEEPEEAAAPAISLEEVRAKLAAFTRAGKQTEVKKLIEGFGVSRLTDIPAEKYPEVLKAVEGIA
ncbi:MAG: hypothetical protein M1548_08570 [Actinobacteria bacterium]|nr:hypothetical protein [Actinomycetota bacterium]